MLTENEKLTLAVAAGSLLISLVSTGIALGQLRVSVRQSRHQATFEHLGRVRKLLRQISEVDPKEARAAALAYWTHQTDELPEAAKAYLDLLDEWDLLGVAYRDKQVDRKIVLKSLRHTLRNPHNVNREFIGQVKKTFENPSMYEDLDYLIKCCARRTWFEWFSEKGKGLYVRSKNRNAATTRTTAFTLVGADTRRGDSGISSTAAAPPDTQAELAYIDVNVPVLEENTVSDSNPAPTPTPAQTPPPPSWEKRGETPTFRPPPPPPVQQNGSGGT